VRKASARQVHGLGVLDLRIFNTDRHPGNILVSSTEQGDVRLIPIDHALSLPDWHFLAEAYFDWQTWPQADVPFDPKMRAAIDAIDAEADAEELRGLGFPEGCVATNRICTAALKAGARAGLTLRSLGQVFQRPFVAGHSLHNQFVSPLEHMVVEAAIRCDVEYPGALPEPPPSPGDQDVDIDEVERRAFGDNPPPEDLFTHLVDVLDRRFLDASWRAFLPIA
jgi:hypothetical protein